MKRHVIRIALLLPLVFVTNLFAQDTLLRTIQLPNSEFYESSDNPFISVVKLSTQNDFIVTGTKNAIVWDIDTGEKEVEFKGHGENNWIKCVAVSSEGKWIASGAHGPEVKVWDSKSGKEISTFITAVSDPHPRNINSVLVSGVSFLERDTKLITANSSGVVQIWDISTQKEIVKFEGFRTITSILWLSEQNVLLVKHTSDFVLLNVNTGDRSKPVWSDNVDYSAVSNRLVSNEGNIVSVFNVLDTDLLTIDAVKLDDYHQPKSISIVPSGKDVLLGKSSNLTRRGNKLFDRFKYIDSNQSFTTRFADPSENPSITSKEETISFNTHYEDRITGYFGDGIRYFTANGAQLNIWKENS